MTQEQKKIRGVQRQNTDGIMMLRKDITGLDYQLKQMADLRKSLVTMEKSLQKDCKGLNG